MPADNELFQYSLALGLMDGVADKGLPLSELLTHGDHGLGTFRHMDGELIVLDGLAYQMKADGSVAALDPSGDAVHPFAQITRFRPPPPPEGRHAAVSVPSKAALRDILGRLAPGSTNRFLAFRIDGAFRSVVVRTAAGQKFPGQGLADVGRDQVEHTFSDVRGTLVGFRQPHYLQGVGVAGDHLHFIAEDRCRGGHVLALESDGEVDVRVVDMWRMVLDLPRGDDEFDNAPLVGDHKQLEAVEG